MSQQSNERIAQRVKETKIALNDYDETIHAIIGFVHLYFFNDETQQPRSDVKRFQGRRLTPLTTTTQSEKQAYVSPDLGIVIQDARGILGEVKKNFPKEDMERGNKIFVQLKNYDQNLIGWPMANQQIQSHEIVLLTHITTSAYAKEFYEKRFPETGLVFKRPFSIVEFGNVPQVQEFFFLKTILGEPTVIGRGEKLKYGVSVPMRVFLREYARTKLYDAEPPLPYLAELIWMHVCTPIAFENPKFEHLRKKQKLEVSLTIEDIVERLDEGFSFHSWHSQHPDHQPQVPRTKWVRQACQFLIASGEAEWIEGSEETQLVIFYQRYDDVTEHFVLSHATLEEEKTSKPMMLPGFEPTETADSR